MSEDELMSKIFKINKEIDVLCYERDQLINKLYDISKKKGTESELIQIGDVDDLEEAYDDTYKEERTEEP